MANRGSQHDQDEIVWATTGVRLGTTGLDLRQPSDPGALTELLNARFLDDRTVTPRSGHYGVLIKDAAGFPALGPNYSVSDRWVYGHGMQVSGTNAAAQENAHHPIAGKGRGIFEFEDTDVVWTGDRLLMVKDEGSALGGSSFWQRENTSSVLSYGIPAFLPLQTDSSPPAAVTGDYVETCLTETSRVIVDTASGTLNARIIDRETDVLVNASEISGASNAPVEPKVFQSGAYVVVLWRDSASSKLYMQSWNGTQWSGEDEVALNVTGFDVAPVPSGFYVAWRTAAELKVGVYSGISSQSTPFAFGSIPPSCPVPTGPMALGVSPSGEVGLLVETAAGLRYGIFSASLATVTAWTIANGNTGWDSGLAICSRGLKNSNGHESWVFHASRGEDTGVDIWELVPLVSANSTTRYNSVLASKSFRVGDEVFCWMRATNAATHYLVGGSLQPQLCGYADRYEATARAASDSNYGVPHVLPDPLDEDATTFTWARPFNTGQSYNRGGNVRLGDIDFLPDLSAAQYGKTVYLSGSAVRNWDGTTLGDAGFQNYPVLSAVDQDGFTAQKYYYRIYAVRYNAKGERFTSAAVSYGPVNNSIVIASGFYTPTLTIKTLPDTNHSDVVFEIYRTEANGTTFYLTGTVANDLGAATVSYVDNITDTAIISKQADPHAAGLEALSELEEGGPLGCAILAVSGDRLWGAGGQVPAGLVQFSKLREEGEGAGFDSLAGFQVVDSEGRPITSVAGLNDATVAFQRDRLHVIAGVGPDNYGRGAFNIPQIVLADGAITHAGTAITQLGTLYWGQKGPRLLTTAFQVHNISAPVRPLAETLVPSGVQVDLSRQEVVWYTASGEALLWNYLGDNSRWAEWSGLKIAGCTSRSLVTTDGRRLVEDPEATGDDGQPITFVWTSGNLRSDQVMQGASLLRSMGVVGKYEGPHKLRFRIFYNGSPLWSEQYVWEPQEGTFLSPASSFAALTPAQVDATKPVDRSGSYATHTRVARHNCHFYRIQVSNLGCDGPSYTPYELSLEVGARGGLARVPVNTYS